MKTIAIIMALFFTAPAHAGIWEAVCEVESGGDPTAWNRAEDAAGVSQIRPIVIEDLNRIYGPRWSLEDRWCPEKSREIFWQYVLYWQERMGYPLTDETLARIWQGGPRGPRRDSTLAYWHRVRERL